MQVVEFESGKRYGLSGIPEYLRQASRAFEPQPCTSRQHMEILSRDAPTLLRV